MPCSTTGSEMPIGKRCEAAIWWVSTVTSPLGAFGSMMLL